MALVRNISARRREVRRGARRGPRALLGLERGQIAWALLFIAALTLIGGLIAMLGLSQPRYRTGEVLRQPILARVAFEEPRPTETAENQRRAAESVPAVYDINAAYFEELEGRLDEALRQLASTTVLREESGDPDRTEGAAEAGDSAAPISEEDMALARVLVQYVGPNGQPTEAWNQLVRAFLYGRADDPLSRGLRGIAVLRDERFKTELAGVNLIRVRFDGREENYYPSRWVSLADRPELEQRIRNLAAQFPVELQGMVVDVFIRNPQRTFSFNGEETERRREIAREEEPQVTVDYLAHESMIEAGTMLTRDHLSLLRLEHQNYMASLTTGELAALRMGQFGFVALIALALWAYIIAYNERIVRNPMRGLAIVTLLLLCQGGAVLLTQADPGLLYMTATFPTLLLAIVLGIAYDQRFALAIAGIHVVLIMFSLTLPISFVVMLLVGVGVALSQLGEVRTRSKLVQVGAYTGIAMALAAVVTSLAQRPVNIEGEFMRIVRDGTLVLFTGLAVGMFVQAILPSIERIFKVTTAIKLRELNDASHPLLQRLAQSAPGTYQHSLRLADITEAAADAIGANGLLCRVGAMYHDVGKMNKPLYFIENQGGGPNRHNKLSPAMSVLIIVGHVKDGIEMAREYGLPPVLRHFIESHHGTTLVEYFYNAAKQQREAEDQPAPTEFEFRYPGPKPQTREAAILMLGDAVESACRSLSEPTPARLEQLVHKMAQKRLLDGQFDESNLTLAELHRIEQAFTKTLCAVYHGRISYARESKPSVGADQQPPESEPRAASSAG